MVLHGERIEQSRPSEQGMVPSRKHARHDNRVDDTPSSIGACHLENNREWRGEAGAGLKIVIVVGHV